MLAVDGRARVELGGAVCDFLFFQAEDGIRDIGVTGVQTCALPILYASRETAGGAKARRLWISIRNIVGLTGGGLAANDGSMGFSIGEVSQAIGLAPQTLRLWEKERLVRPRRTDRGYRVYTEPDVERLRQIKQLRKVEGLNFAAIRKQLGTAEDKEENGSMAAGPAGAPGERLRRLRVRAHKTLKEVSEATGLSISFISALERGGSGDRKS